MNKMDAISQTIFTDAFSECKVLHFDKKKNLKRVSKGPIDNNPALVTKMTWCRILARSHYLNRCWPLPLTHICDTRGDKLTERVIYGLASIRTTIYQCCDNAFIPNVMFMRGNSSLGPLIDKDGDIFFHCKVVYQLGSIGIYTYFMITFPLPSGTIWAISQ